jgi:hypothetical protein
MLLVSKGPSKAEDFKNIMQGLWYLALVALVTFVVVMAILYLPTKSADYQSNSLEEAKTTLAEKLGGDFANEPWDYLLDGEFETQKRSLYLLSGYDSMGRQVKVDVWVLEDQVEYHVEVIGLLESLES